MSETAVGLEPLIDEMYETGSGDVVSFGEIIEHVAHRGFGALLIVPGLLAVMPTGAIPGMGVITGIMTICIAGQMVVGRDHPWLPRQITKRTIDRGRFRSSIERARGPAARIDRWIGPRLEPFVRPAMKRLIALVSVVIGIGMILIAPIPFANAVGGVAIIFFALGFVVRDGLLVLIGLFAAIAMAALGLRLF